MAGGHDHCLQPPSGGGFLYVHISGRLFFLHRYAVCVCVCVIQEARRVHGIAREKRETSMKMHKGGDAGVRVIYDRQAFVSPKARRRRRRKKGKQEKQSQANPCFSSKNEREINIPKAKKICRNKQISLEILTARYSLHPWVVDHANLDHSLAPVGMTESEERKSDGWMVESILHRSLIRLCPPLIYFYFWRMRRERTA